MEYPESPVLACPSRLPTVRRYASNHVSHGRREAAFTKYPRQKQEAGLDKGKVLNSACFQSHFSFRFPSCLEWLPEEWSATLSLPYLSFVQYISKPCLAVLPTHFRHIVSATQTAEHASATCSAHRKSMNHSRNIGRVRVRRQSRRFAIRGSRDASKKQQQLLHQLRLALRPRRKSTQRYIFCYRILIPRSSLTSPIITVCVGRDQRLFAAHEDVLSNNSYYFQQIIHGQVWQGSPKQISLPNEEPEIFSSILEYLYKGDYYPRLVVDKKRNSWSLEDAGSAGRSSVETTVYVNGIGVNILKDTVIYVSPASSSIASVLPWTILLTRR